MNTTVEALKKLYVKMGGDIADVEEVTLIPDMIAAIEEVYSGGGGGGTSNVAFSFYHIKFKSYSTTPKETTLTNTDNIELVGGEVFTGTLEDVVYSDVKIMKYGNRTGAAADAALAGVNIIGGLEDASGTIKAGVIASEDVTIDNDAFGVCLVICWKK